MVELNKEIRIRVDEELHSELQAIAKKKNKHIADICRGMLRDGVGYDGANQSLDIVQREIRRTVKEQLKPFENRIAAMTSKSTIMSSTAAYIMQYILRDHANVDPRPVWETSRKKAVAYLKGEKE